MEIFSTQPSNGRVYYPQNNMKCHPIKQGLQCYCLRTEINLIDMIRDLEPESSSQNDNTVLSSRYSLDGRFASYNTNSTITPTI
jgi:hypothetical protein